MQATPKNILARVEYDTNGGCWLWAGVAAWGGYGDFFTEGRLHKAHRVAYRAFVGPIPEGMFVCHRCDVRACVNPDHLFVGSHVDNMRDMRAKGRAPPRHGEHNGRNKLTEEDAAYVRRSSEPARVVAARMGITPTAVRSIRNGLTWTHLASAEADHG